MKRLIKLIRDEKGQALIITLILLVVGGLTITPLLGLISTGLLTGQVYESKMHALYAADAGVEDALWRIKNVELTDFLGDYDEYDYDSQWPYALNESVNDYSVNYTIENVWIPKDIPAPSPETANRTIEQGTVIIAGNPPLPGGSQYEIKISYQSCVYSVNTVGIWLPPGFEYVVGSSDLEKASGETYCEPDVDPYKGGYAVVWDFVAPVPIANFPKSIKFDFTGPEDQSPDNAVSWISYSTDEYDITAWDADVKVYKISSTATDTDTEKQTTVESYTSRIELRKLGSAISGDYVAVGNSLLTPTGDVNYRDQLYMQSSATIQSGEPEEPGYIPPDATVEAAFLYWSGWIDYHYYYDQGTQWGEISELNYDNYAPNNLKTLVETNAKVNTLTLLFGTGDPATVTADNWQVFESTSSLIGPKWEGTWIYSCLYDATNLTKQLIADEKLEPNGDGIYTVKHAVVESRPGYDTYSFELHDTGQETGYPLGTPAHKYPGEQEYQNRYVYSYAGWSLIIIYSSPETKGHQLYLYDIDNPNFKFREAWGAGDIPNPDFDGDGSPGGTISGFLVPQPVEGEVNAAKITCFVGEGDSTIAGDYMKVNGESLPDGTGIPLNNVWNSNSIGLTVPGVDIDTFYVTWNSGILESGDTSAQVDLPTGNDGFTLIYIILSFRSSTTSGGVMGFLIK